MEANNEKKKSQQQQNCCALFFIREKCKNRLHILRINKRI